MRIAVFESAIGNRQFRRAFTLTEILIVIGLIVLMIALAVPTLSFLTGSRSVEGAQNNVSAMLGRARAEAIGLQEVRGVFFFIEKSTGRVAMALVREVEPPTAATFNPPTFVSPTEPRPEVWLDLVPESEFVTLPSGVGLQTVDDALTNAAGVRLEDGYIGYNQRNVGNNRNPAEPASDTHTRYGGVILFDGSGQLVSRRYAFKTFTIAPGSGRQPTRMGDLLYRPSGDPTPLDHTATINDVVPLSWLPPGIGTSEYYGKSHVGVVLYERERLSGGVPLNPNSPQPREYDWQIHQGDNYAQGASAGWDESHEETWLDENGLALLVNRYNGTLVRAQ